MPEALPDRASNSPLPLAVVAEPGRPRPPGDGALVPSIRVEDGSGPLGGPRAGTGPDGERSYYLR
jgi:hypothetical protein